MEREADLLVRGLSTQAMAGLRKRIATLFFQYCRTPLFNPESAKHIKVRVSLLCEHGMRRVWHWSVVRAWEEGLALVRCASMGRGGSGIGPLCEHGTRRVWHWSVVRAWDEEGLALVRCASMGRGGSGIGPLCEHGTRRVWHWSIVRALKEGPASVTLPHSLLYSEQLWRWKGSGSKAIMISTFSTIMYTPTCT